MSSPRGKQGHPLALRRGRGQPDISGFRRRKMARRAGGTGGRSPVRDRKGKELRGLPAASPHTPSVQWGSRARAAEPLLHLHWPFPQGLEMGPNTPQQKSRDPRLSHYQQQPDYYKDGENHGSKGGDGDYIFQNAKFSFYLPPWFAQFLSSPNVI